MFKICRPKLLSEYTWKVVFLGTDSIVKCLYCKPCLFLSEQTDVVNTGS